MAPCRLSPGRRKSAGVSSRPVGPIVEHDDPLGVVVGRGLGVVDDQRQVEPVSWSRPTCGCVPNRCRVGHRRICGERLSGGDIRGGRCGAVHVVLQGDAVPVHRRRVVEFVVQHHLKLVPTFARISGRERCRRSRVSRSPCRRDRPSPAAGSSVMVTVRPVCGRAPAALIRIGEGGRDAGRLGGQTRPGCSPGAAPPRLHPCPPRGWRPGKVRRVRFSDALIADLTFLDETVPPLFAPESLTGRDVGTGDHPLN